MKNENNFEPRFFAPVAGINEDPVTGSANSCLSTFWRKRLGRSELAGYRSAARSGVVRVWLVGGRVALGGEAVTVSLAELI